MKKRFLIQGVLVGLYLIAGCSSAGSGEERPGNQGALDEERQEHVIRVGTSGKTIPSTFYDEKNELAGYDIDVINEIAERSGYEVEYTVADFSGLFGLIESNRIDTIANQAEVTEEREQKFDFTEPYVYSAWQLVVREDDDSIQSLNDLDGKTIAQGLGTAKERYLEEFQAEHGQDFTLESYEDSDGIFLDIVNGRIDASLVDYQSGLFKIEKSGLDLKYAGEPFAPTVFAFPFKEENDDLRQLFDEKLAEMKADGKLKELSEKWFELDITEPLVIK